MHLSESTTQSWRSEALNSILNKADHLGLSIFDFLHLLPNSGLLQAIPDHRDIHLESSETRGYKNPMASQRILDFQSSNKYIFESPFQNSTYHVSSAINLKMQLISTLLPILLASTFTLALPVTKTKRSATTVLSDIASISSDVATLTSDAVAYTGGLFQSLALAITVDSLESAITTATSDTTSSGIFSSTDSDSILAAVTTLTPKIVTLLSDLDAKVSLNN